MKKLAITLLHSFFGIIYRFQRHYDYYASTKKLATLKAGFKRTGGAIYISFPNKILNPQYISIGENFSALWNLRLEAWDEYLGKHFQPSIIIGDNVHVNSDVHIGCIDKVIIGNNVLMASRIYISDHSHGEISNEAIEHIPVERLLVSRGPVIIEDNVWVGEGVCILSGVTIGKNSIIGANAVVTGSVPANTVVAGIPARVIKTLA